MQCSSFYPIIRCAIMDIPERILNKLGIYTLFLKFFMLSKGFSDNNQRPLSIIIICRMKDGGRRGVGGRG